jgi:FtsH-binding integral membrane protein
MTDRLSLRAWLAGLLVLSPALFLVGIALERRTTTDASPAAVQPEPSAHVEGEGGESGEGSEAAHSAVPAEANETPEQHAAEILPLGIDLESPLLVGGAILVSLVLAVAVLRSTNPLIPTAIVGFAVLFGVLDLLELAHQIGESNTGIALMAALIAVVHGVIAIIAIRLLMDARGVAAVAK